MHSWCSQHDEIKYRKHFDNIKELTLKRLKLGEIITIKEMKPPSHLKKADNDPQNNKYIDIRKEEEIYFPRLGAFEIYADKILIFSKLKSNSWPSD